MKLYIGTSGWMYKDWNGLFYPKELKSADQLPYYAGHFKTVEINSTFYHMPQAKSVQRWYDVTPKDFVFTIKLSRYLTHTKRLAIDEEFDDYLREFMERIKPLKQKLAVILIQLPPSLKCEEDRLEHCAKKLREFEKKFKLKFSVAIEFRHKSWFTPEIFQNLDKLNVANVIIDSPGRWPANTEIKLYASSYPDKELKKWADFIKTKTARCKYTFVYFNNDFHGFALDNARTLKNLVS
jgi:uncharacterized protein YecE (DUF72 family)